MKYIKIYTLFALLTSFWGFAQCNTASFTVTKTNGTCPSNASITVTVPTSTNCSAWVAQIKKTTVGSVPVELSVPTTGGDITFGSLTPGSYNVSLSDGISTIQYASNPVVLTTSYVGMAMTFSSVPPTCMTTAPGFTIDGTFTSNVTGGVGPFTYKLTTSNGVQTATSSLRSYTFNNVPGGEQVTIQITDLVNNTPGCESTIVQSPTLAPTTAAELAYAFRQYNFIRDCDNCANPKLFINLDNLTAERRAILLQPGNAIITIAGVDYPLTYIAAQNRFTYDPATTFGPVLVDGMSIKTTFNWGCKILTRTSLVSMKNDFLGISSSILVDNTNCSLKYRINVSGGEYLNGNENIYFCPTNTVVVEKRISTSPDVWQVVSGSAISPDPATLTAGLPVVGGLTSGSPTANNYFFVYQPGTYRVTASDACHTVSKTITIVESLPINSLSAYTRTSILSGTVGFEVNTGSYTGSFPMTVQVDRVDGQTAMPISPTQPYNYAGNYTINFPITKTFATNPSWFNIMDLPPGQYKIKFTDGCSATTGNVKEQIINLTNTAGYSPQYAVTTGCNNSNKINFNLNPNSFTYKPYATQLKTTTGSLLQSIVGTTGVFSNVSSGDYTINYTSVGNNGSSYSAALNSFAPFNYSTSINVAPYQDFVVSTSSNLCDMANTNSGIVSAQIVSGSIVYPLTFSLYSTSNPATPIQGPFSVVSPADSYVFTGVSVGNYFVRVASSCFISDKNIAVSSVSTIPTANASDPVICPNKPTTLLSINASNNLYDVTWRDSNNVVVGTGTPISLTPSVTTTYTASYILRSTFGCPSPTTYTSDVTVVVTPNPDLTLAVSDINLCDGTSPSVIISNTQNAFSYEIVNSSGTSFSPPLIANGNGGSLTIPIPNTITLVAGQTLKVKSTNGNAGCSGFLTDVSNVVSGTFNITCPTFPLTSVQCYADLPSKTSYTIAQFQALGNGNGSVDVVGCGVVEITATNGADPGCEGNVTRTYTITEYADPNNNDVRDSGENTILKQTTCTQTITIERADFTMPANGASTVACQADIVTPTVPTVTDNCGNTLTPSAPVISTIPTCEGNVTYTYTFTDCEGNTHDWVYTYTIERADFTMPANGASTVACQADIVTPTVPTVSDNCGNTLTPSAPVISTIPTCEGNVTYTYTFTDCEGNTHDWVYTYTIERADFTMPANGASTVACQADIVTPTVPTVTDNCGNTLTPSAPVVSTTPTCEGNVTYTYTFTDCEGNAHDWVYTYTIERADFTMPANGASTVACQADIVTPTVPTVTDNCGNTLTPSAPVVSTTPTCEGNVIYTYTFTDCEGNTHDWVYTYTIERADFTMPANGASTVACQADIVTPTVPTVTDNCGNTLTPSAPVVSTTPTCEGNVTYTYTFTDCEGNTHDWVYTYTIERADFTMPANGASTVACQADIVTPTVPTVTDNCGNTLTPSAPVVSTTPTCEGNVTYTYTFTDCEGNTHDWVYTYTIERADFTMPANGASTVACQADIVTPTVPTVTDNCGNTLTPSAPVVSTTPTCEGNVTYTYTFTDCEGNAHDWVYTYTIERADFTMPANGSSTVACSADIVTPTVPTVTDNCGNTLTPSAPVVSTTPTCEGNVTYTYTFTDCEGNAHDWVYTYTIERADFTMPANGASTVACQADIVTPTVPTVTDNCGNTLTPSAPVVSTTPTCEGNVTYTYTFTDCEGNAHDWVYTYTIERADFTMPANGSSTVACSADIVTPTVPTVTDNCGNTLTPSAPVVSTTPTCEGNVTYTYTFTDCEGNAHDWVYTYTIERADFTMPANGSSTVACSADIVTPTVPTVTDNCGNTLTPSAPVVSTTPTCEGNVTYTYTFTDCEGNAHDWVYTYTIERADFTMPANGSSTVACSAAIVTPTVPTVKDNCNNTLTPSAPVISTIPTCEGNVTYTYTFTDCEGNTHDWVYTYIIDDTISPTGTAPADLTLQCIADIPTANVNEITDEADNCLGSVTVTVADTNNGGSGCQGNPYIVSRTYSLTDCAGNVMNLVQTITVQDTVKPTFVEALPADITVECSAIPTAAVLTATDNCGTATVTYAEVKTNGTCANNYSLARTWTATDACGLKTSHTQTITVQDTVKPTFVEALPADVTVECSAVPTVAVLTATDNCGTATVTYAEVKTNGTCANNYSLARTWTATDACGLKTSHTQTITVQDTVKPTFVEALPADATVECSAVPTAAVLTATDNCGTATVTYAEVKTNGTCANNYSLARTWTATDQCGNISKHIQVITVQDTTKPVVNETAGTLDRTLKCSDSQGLSNALALVPTATDNCSANLILTLVSDSTNGGTTCGYSRVRKWNFKDECGNISLDFIQTIVVADPALQTLIVAANDAVSGIDGFSGVKNVLNILTNDFVDAANATINNVSISVITPEATGKIVLNPDGSVDVKPGTPAGVYTLVYEICTINTPKVCDQATVTITVVVPVIIAVNDDYSSKPIDASKGVILDILGNDKINNGTVSPSQVTITILDTNGLAGVTVDTQGKITIPAGAPIGTYVLTYRICDVINPSNCATATVTIVVKDPCDFDDSAASCDIVIHNAFSPNNDGINEVFFIERIEKYPDNSVEIYNRWGILVFEVSGYDNTSKVFVGLSEGRVTVNKADALPDGTYYYVVKYKKPISGKVNQKAGFLYLSK